MISEEMLQIASRNLKKAEIAFRGQINRPGITEKEKRNLYNNLKYAEIVKDLIEKAYQVQECESERRAYGDFKESWEYEMEE